MQLERRRYRDLEWLPLEVCVTLSDSLSQQSVGANKQDGFPTSSCPAFAKSTASAASLEARSSSKSRVILLRAAMIDE